MLKELRNRKKEPLEINYNLRAPILRGTLKNESYSLYFEETNLESMPYSMPFIILPTRPCSWLRRSGGCFMCGYSNLSNLRIEDRTILNLFDKALEVIKNVPHRMVAIGTSGSFLDPQELPEDVQDSILKKACTLPDIKIIGIESRPEFISSERIREISEIVYPKKINIGMGLESSNDLIREFCINKGLTTDVFLRALSIIKKQENVSALAYVLLGKPFLPRDVDMLDAINSINFALNKGFDMVVLMATTLRENTLTKMLYDVGEYRPPTPRMVIEVLKRLDPTVRSKVIIAIPRLPKPINVDQCPICSELLEQLILMYKYTLNFNYITLADKIDFGCQCTKEYEKPLEDIETLDLERLILSSYDRAIRKIKEVKR
jgi:radical SAM enzyme (TIGR01210 family)